jgi:hypothetical protein
VSVDDDGVLVKRAGVHTFRHYCAA